RARASSRDFIAAGYIAIVSGSWLLAVGKWLPDGRGQICIGDASIGKNFKASPTVFARDFFHDCLH
ncbi:MAG: hypothetical protein ACXVH7_08365, partial [Thermoanaerobaculia bacterium]